MELGDRAFLHLRPAMQRVAAAFEPASLHVPDSLQGDLRRDHSGAQQIDHIDALPAAGGAAAAPLRGLLRRLNLDNDICIKSTAEVWISHRCSRS